MSYSGPEALRSSRILWKAIIWLPKREVWYPAEPKPVPPRGTKKASPYPLLQQLVLQTEGVQGATLRDLSEARGLGHRRGTDRPVLIVHIEPCRHRQSDPAADTAEHRHVLVPLDRVGDRVADDSGAELP